MEEYQAVNDETGTEMRASLLLYPDGTSVLIFANGDEQTNDLEVTLDLLNAYRAELMAEL